MKYPAAAQGRLPRCTISVTLPPERCDVPTKNPRINIAVERPLYLLIGRMAKQRGLSRSAVTRDLIREALEIQEDSYLARFAEGREGSLDARSTLAHDEVWR